MLAAERRDLLVARLRRDGKLIARDLAVELGLSEDSVRRDLRDPAALLADPVIRGHLDFGRPIAVILLAILHFIGDDDDPAVVKSIHERRSRTQSRTQGRTTEKAALS